MNYIGRKDNGSYISSKQKTDNNNYSHLLHPIAYNKDVAELAAQQKRKYREVYLELMNEIDDGE